MIITVILYIAGWSSPVARQAHNLKVVGSNPTPATNFFADSIFVTNILKKYKFIRRNLVKK
jgi:hypothetical protein